MHDISRREALALGAAGAGLAVAPAAAAQPIATPRPSLNEIGRAKGLRFGSAVSAGSPERRSAGGSIDNPAYATVLAGECGLLVPENEMKMQFVRPNATTFDFARADRIMAFAEQRGLAVRGHNLLWHNTKWLPKWLNEHDFGSRPASTAETLLVQHVTTVCRHFGERIRSWDVVNETIDPKTGAMRSTALTRHLGDRVIDIAFHAARAALPSCQLVYNDYMEWEGGNERHRAGVLRLLHQLRDRGVPVDALGLQSHIGGDAEAKGPAGRPQPEAWSRFLREVSGIGYDLLITELDINDRGFATDPTLRDRQVARYARDYLDLTLSFPNLHDVLVWGMVDRFSWLQEWAPRRDHTPQRCTPYDSSYRPKLLRQAIADAFAAAPPRRPPHPPRV